MAPAVHAGGGGQTALRSRCHRRLEAEILLLQGAHQRWMAQHGRSTVGLSGLAIAEGAHYVADWLRGKAPPSPRDGFSAPLILRFAVDDLKAYCLEAAAAGPAKPSSRQLGDWLWNETATGAALHALRDVLLPGRRAAAADCRQFHGSGRAGARIAGLRRRMDGSRRWPLTPGERSSIGTGSRRGADECGARTASSATGMRSPTNIAAARCGG